MTTLPMLEPKPTRRDPRVLAILPTPDGVQYAALDAWEVAGTGAFPADDAKAVALSVRRLIVQTRPSVLVCAPPPKGGRSLRRLLKLLATVAAHSGIPLVSLAGDLARELLDAAPDPHALGAQYPELRALEVKDGADAVRLASAALTSLRLPPRTYAAPTPPPEPSVAPRASGRSRRPRLPRVTPARGAPRPRRRRGGSRARPPRP